MLLFQLISAILFLISFDPATCVSTSVYKSTKEQILVGHAYSSFLVKNKRHCLAYCQRTFACWSVNYEPSSDLGLCTLSDSDDLSYSDHMLMKQGNVYYRKVSINITGTHTIYMYFGISSYS